MGRNTVRPGRRYEHSPLSVSLWVRAYGHVAARRDRSGVLRGFLRDNGVRRVRDINVQQLPKEKYIIRTQYLEHLADVRDAHILREAKRARVAQEHLQLEIDELEATLRNETELLLGMKNDYRDIKTALRGELTPLEKANYQGQLGAIEANVRDQLVVVSDLRAELAECQKHLIASQKEFAEFCAKTNGAYELVMNGYVKVAGRRLSKLGMTNYDAALRHHTSDIAQKIEELTNG